MNVTYNISLLINELFLNNNNLKINIKIKKLK